MNLDKFYSLRKDFIILGLTGRVGSGCSEIAETLSNKDFVAELDYKPKKPLLKPEKIKFDICYNFLKEKDNFSEFKTINYKNVLLLHLIFESSFEENPKEYILKVLCQYGDGYSVYINRFGKKSDSKFITEITEFLENDLEAQLKFFKGSTLEQGLGGWLKKNNSDGFINYFFNEFEQFSNSFFQILTENNNTKRSRFLHDIAINLREVGKCFQNPKETCNNLDNIYTVAETINRLIKLWRNKNEGKAQIVIDALKNSLELMYFKEKYSGFYMVAVNKSDDERKSHTKKVIGETHYQEIINLDNAEYKGDAVNKGEFAAPDVENCIQKSDYHIYHSSSNDINGKDRHTNLSYQLVKFLALINQPGIITPTPIERTMQVAFNAKYNSGCISRQVGAVVTDENYFIKSIGWNDVAQNQMPCKLRSIEDLVNGKSEELFSDYEKFEKGKWLNKQTKGTFKDLVTEDLDKAKLEHLNGRHCSFCFKTFQNTYEGEKNQVHTRSLHAEENAMMQIAKNGGLGLKNGYLFTTASPCELCSKKAFQLGVTKIFYIDPYPGIAMSHTLKNGVKSKKQPKLEMFRGAVGRVFHKLYEPFMSQKDEINILTGLEPKRRDLPLDEVVDGWDIEGSKKDKIKKILNER